ncbi:hypothetical protein N0B31_06790 [Salinirubellus salinus]|uniref:Uncharacterized protein n=1 Tax=Salinirubellus salinus TaxID=1364945 RepID=A0A9E7R6A0_9EURY|nr:hypothetical protein [Salinirubellus salinus]UWM55989.1 hypothetical protein N0B31_06790 [Salinirubellus salinus]
MATTALREEVREELVRTARTVVGDELRSLTHFTEETVDQLYLRSDLDPEADLTGFAETERLGFRSQWDYGASELGDYRFTIRVFDHGYLTRVIVGNHGVFVTTDSLARTRFEELAAAIKGVLREYA